MASVTLTATRARQAMRNSAVVGRSGALGIGDRGGFQGVPYDTGNPHDSNDYMTRWRAYCHLYETSWEARKIVRIVPDDALRKDWIVEGLPEEAAQSIKTELDRLRFRPVLSRSLMLERLLGGSLVFLGLEGEEDDAAKPYHPHEGKRLRFTNAIPVSRIQRINWCSDPLSERYMRPDAYMVNGHEVHVSRFLVWDGDPLFDPMDFALTRYRSNMAGFGPSVLATVWDDIIKAVGTRQAAYHLIQTNNAILAAVQDLQDLQGTETGRKALQKVKEIANQISVYRAALIDGEGVEIKQHSASFGSVPELIITFIQVLAAASDIPATRFLGQAPGGLNATGESDLENYYNVIDSYQRQRIEPELRRMYDIIGYAKFRQGWKKLREKLEFKFPPLWNPSELEEAQKAGHQIDNVMKLFEQGLIAEEKVLEELNAKGALSVTLDETDIQVVEDATLPPPPGGPGGEGTSQPRQGGQVPMDVLPPRTGEKPQEGPVGPVQRGGLEELRNVARGRSQVQVPQGYVNAARNATELEAEARRNLATYPMAPKGCKSGRAESGGVVRHVDTCDGEPDRVQFWFERRKRSKASVDQFMQNEASALPPLEYEKLMEAAGGGPGVFAPAQLEKGYLVEQEHADVTGGDPVETMKIVLAHLTEQPDYYDRLERVENTLPLDRLPAPTNAQKDAGNYKKHHLRLHGLDISIENPWGSERKGVAKDGTEWSSILPAHYGYIRKSEGADGDHVDVYVGPHEHSEQVYVVDQVDPDTREFDEHKCIFGALSLTQAKGLYLSGFSDDKAESRLGAIHQVTLPEFKAWLAGGDTRAPYTNAVM